MTKFTQYTGVVMVLLGSSSNLYAASFDCNKAATLVEQAICSNQKLSNLDQQLATMYKQALANSPNQEAIRERQREWLKWERNSCQDIACIKDAYLSRLTELQDSAMSIQPISGEYQRYYRGKLDKNAATLTVSELSNGRVEIKGNAIWIGNEETGNVNTGEIEGIFTRQGNKINYQDPGSKEDGCQLTITFTEKALTVTDDNLRCGGLNVTFDGMYRKLRQ